MHMVQPLSAIDLVKHFPSLRLLIIGDALLDSYLEGEAARLSRDGPIPVVKKTTEQRLPGGAANVAANVAALGATVCFLSVIGNDLAGSLLRSTLKERGLDDQWLLTDPNVQTPHKLRIMADGQHIARFDEGESQMADATPETRQLLLASLTGLFPHCDAIVVSDYQYGVLSEEVIACLTRLQHTDPKVLLIDSQTLTRFRRFPATIVTPNYQEFVVLAEEISDHPFGAQGLAVPEQLPDVARVARETHAGFAADYLAITLAERGVLLLDRQGYAHHFPAHPIAVAHDVGAGDSFASALILTLAAGGPVEEAVQVGIDAAGIAVSKPRTAVVSYQELLQRVSLRVYTSQSQETVNTSQAVLARVATQLEGERLAGRTIVFTNGIFDILHVGHLQFLKQAKALGDILVVAVNSDSSARRLKGPGRPITSEQDRLALVEALDMVDYALLFDADTAIECIQTLHPTLYVKGSDHNDKTLPETEAVQEVGGRVVILPLAGSLRTSQVIERIKQA
jgi:D-beta-D-heptose 7-phosphate kinase / D-beta-D-heptose 1-phosphate adenosyltransferase